MSEIKPCCAASLARKVKKLNIGGTLIGISMLDSIIEEVSKMDINDQNEIKHELIKRVKVYNYVTSSAEKDYADTVFEEYERQISE
ncbi:MAG: hypothetical protein HOC71_04070 [Candidatus Latescibacteria bacterium]|jgi:hypothetical protein|nr:hypothetical protein [Candidatus Latescibacterota bacterium]